jgi:hypothetical protein
MHQLSNWTFTSSLCCINYYPFKRRIKSHPPFARTGRSYHNLHVSRIRVNAILRPKLMKFIVLTSFTDRSTGRRTGNPLHTRIRKAHSSSLGPKNRYSNANVLRYHQANLAISAYPVLRGLTVLDIHWLYLTSLNAGLKMV